MKLFKMFKRGQKGFTLVELMVVMGIMAVLAAIVVPAVTGTKGTSETTALFGDANAVQQAASKFNNETTVAGLWPETAALTTDNITNLGTVTGVTNGTHTMVNWLATTTIRNSIGALVPVSFVPDFVPMTPKSDAVISDSKHVYIWLFRLGADTGAQTRTLEVYKLDDAGDTYTKVN